MLANKLSKINAIVTAAGDFCSQTALPLFIARQNAIPAEKQSRS
jgi:hypothetical protein